MKEEFGDFEEIKEPQQIKKHTGEKIQENQSRIRLPKKGEILGIVMQRLGGNRMEIKASDGKTRNCRVPGRFKRKFWLRNGDTVLIVPWEYDNSKGDIIFQYNKNAAHQLKKRGLLANLEEGF